MTGSQRPYLRIVGGAIDSADSQPKQTVASPSTRDLRQPMLFSDASFHTLGFIMAGELDADKFASLIRDAKPRIIFDLRSVPRFARRTLSRKAVFSLFEDNGVKYFDVAGSLGLSGRRDGLLNPALLINALQVNVLRHTKGLSGPIFFFVNDDLFNDEYFSAVARELPNQDGRGWEITCWPNEPISTEHTKRDLVFISHANPEDNEVALWLASRLAASGYRVWSDVTRLVGGELFWDTIEDAIRTKAAKVIVLLSQRGHQKPGLLDEVNVAIATERTERLQRFVIPVRLDDLPFANVRANLARKNIIDGNANLASAFSKILTALKEDRVPKTIDPLQTSLQERYLSIPKKQGSAEWNVLFENKIDILCWPRAIRKFKSSRIAFPFASHPVTGGFVTFEDWDVVEATMGAPVTRAGEASFELADSSRALDLVFSNRAETRRAMTSLMRQAWDAMCETRGFSRFVLANNSSCWFLANGFEGKNRVRYLDANGVERHKLLLGRSPRRKVFWHFAIEARADAGSRSFRVVPHVLFSEDGKTPIASHERQHALRRGFCRNWWNARWRDLLIATLTYMSNGSEKISLPASKRSVIDVSARLKRHVVEKLDSDTKVDISRSVTRFEEPQVAVGYGQTNDYPKEGLLLFGPVPFARNPKSIRTGVIGTAEGVDLFRTWSKQFNAFQADPAASRNSMPFPGFESVFGAKWEIDPSHVIALSRADLINAILLHDRHQAIFKSSGMYVDKIEKAVREDDIDVDIWFVVIPDEIFLYGRPASRVPTSMVVATPGAMGRKVARRFTSDSPSLFPEDNSEAKVYDHHLDFHHQLKARLLDVRAITQVMRESSLATITVASALEVPALIPETVGDAREEYDFDDLNVETDASDVTEDEILDATEDDQTQDTLIAGAPVIYSTMNRHMQDRASVAWNLSTTAFFKSGGRPWRIANARPEVCYIGLIFKKDPSLKSRQSCSGAQMFLQDSDGLVFKGAMGPWYSPETGQFHISRGEASNLIGTVLKSYAEEHHNPPRELFIHGRTRFNDDEWRGFCDAIDESRTRLTGIRITRTNEFKLFSSGERAVRRGTAIRLSSRVGLLWTSGYVERLGTYPGRETPNPLRVEIVNDTARDQNIDVVMEDILMLTKMNFNSCVYGDGIPVTMRFADAIGDVLITAKDKRVPPLPFRHYI